MSLEEKVSLVMKDFALGVYLVRYIAHECGHARRHDRVSGLGRCGRGVT
jgi:hypothetical protein